MKKNSRSDSQAGAAHLLLVGLIVLVLAGALGYAAYNAYQRSQVASTLSSSEKQNLDIAKAKLEAGDVYTLTDTEKTVLDKTDVKVELPTTPTTSKPTDDNDEPTKSDVVGNSPAPVTDAPWGTVLRGTATRSTKSNALPAYREIVAVSGNLWFTNANTSLIGKMTPSGSVTSFSSSVQGAYFTPIVKGADGNVWFAGNTQKIHKMTLSGKETTYAIPSSPALVENMVLGPDKNVWFTTWNNGAPGVVGKVTPQGKVTEYKLPRGGSIRGLTVAEDKVWFGTSYGAGIVSSSGTIKYVDGNSYPHTPWGIAYGGGYVWVLGHGSSSGSDLIRISTKSGYASKGFTNSQTKSMFRLYSGPEGSVWFSDWQGGKIGRIYANGSTKTFNGPKGLTNALGLTFLNGNVWASYAGPLKANQTSAPGNLVEFKF